MICTPISAPSPAGRMLVENLLKGSDDSLRPNPSGRHGPPVPEPARKSAPRQFACRASWRVDLREQKTRAPPNPRRPRSYARSRRRLKHARGFVCRTYFAAATNSRISSVVICGAAVTAPFLKLIMPVAISLMRSAPAFTRASTHSRGVSQVVHRLGHETAITAVAMDRRAGAVHVRHQRTIRRSRINLLEARPTPYFVARVAQRQSRRGGRFSRGARGEAAAALPVFASDRPRVFEIQFARLREIDACARPSILAAACNPPDPGSGASLTVSSASSRWRRIFADIENWSLVVDDVRIAQRLRTRAVEQACQRAARRGGRELRQRELLLRESCSLQKSTSCASVQMAITASTWRKPEVSCVSPSRGRPCSRPRAALATMG